MPNTKILFITGYVAAALNRGESSMAVDSSIAKPFDLEQLGR